MSTESSPGSQVRASDAEREEYATIVREAVGEGRLSLAEGEERLAAVYGARHRDDLRPLIADLPKAQELAGARGYPGYGYGRRGWAPPAFPPAFSSAPSDAPAPRRGPAFARHTGFVLVVAALLTGLWALTGASFFWPAIPLTFLVLSLARHAFGLGWRRRW